MNTLDGLRLLRELEYEIKCVTERQIADYVELHLHDQVLGRHVGTIRSRDFKSLATVRTTRKAILEGMFSGVNGPADVLKLSSEMHLVYCDLQARVGALDTLYFGELNRAFGGLLTIEEWSEFRERMRITKSWDVWVLNPISQELSRQSIRHEFRARLH